MMPSKFYLHLPCFNKYLGLPCLERWLTIRQTFQNWRHDTQLNDTQHNDTQHNDIQHNDTQHNVLTCDTPLSLC
jgi:hypothetical protein